MKPAFKIASPRWSPCPLTMVDNLIPSTKQTFRDRMSFPARPGTILCEGVRVSTPSGRHPLKVNEGFLKANTLLFGGTGTGKSTYLHWLALTLIREGRAVCVVDPHGTLISSIMGYLDGGAESGRVVYVDPVRCPLGLNPFEVFRTDGRQDEVSSLPNASFIVCPMDSTSSDETSSCLRSVLNTSNGLRPSGQRTGSTYTTLPLSAPPSR